MKMTLNVAEIFLEFSLLLLSFCDNFLTWHDKVDLFSSLFIFVRFRCIHLLLILVVEAGRTYSLLK